jgi:hypothetical protein
MSDDSGEYGDGIGERRYWRNGWRRKNAVERVGSGLAFGDHGSFYFAGRARETVRKDKNVSLYSLPVESI